MYGAIIPANRTTVIAGKDSSKGRRTPVTISRIIDKEI
jgi:hypothetical protein